MEFKDFLRGCLYTSLFIASFICGLEAQKDRISNNMITINGQKVEVVDVVYRYINNEGQEVKGDYSFSVNNGYEYTEDGSYDYEYQNAEISK